MNCVRSPSLEWESTGKRASRVITIRAEAHIHTSNSVIYGPCISSLQTPNEQHRKEKKKKEIGRGIERDRRRKKINKGREISALYLYNFTFHSKAWREFKQWYIFFFFFFFSPWPLNNKTPLLPPTACFVVLCHFSGDAPVFFREHICLYFVECSSLYRAVTPVWRLVHP